MPTINTSIPQVCFSYALPDVVQVTTSAANAEVQALVYVDGETVFSTNLYAVNSKVYLHDIRTIIEEAIRANNDCQGNCDLGFIEGSTSTGANGFRVVISDRDINQDSSWLATHFLTTRTAMLISRNGKQRLTWFCTQAESMTYKIVAKVRNAQGVVNTVNWTTQSAATVSMGIYSYLVKMSDINAYFVSGTVISFTVYRGNNRSMDFFVVDEPPQKTFLFLNNFNAEEYAEVYAASIMKTKMEASEARLLRKRIKYDFDPEQTFDLESAFLSKEEAEWMSQMLTSRYVGIQVGTAWKEILVDGEAEVSDSRAAENRFKMTYKFAAK